MQDVTNPVSLPSFYCMLHFGTMFVLTGLCEVSGCLVAKTSLQSPGSF
jgi:hypothetical protein